MVSQAVSKLHENKILVASIYFGLWLVPKEAFSSTHKFSPFRICACSQYKPFLANNAIFYSRVFLLVLMFVSVLRITLLQITLSCNIVIIEVIQHHTIN